MAAGIAVATFAFAVSALIGGIFYTIWRNKLAGLAGGCAMFFIIVLGYFLGLTGQN